MKRRSWYSITNKTTHFDQLWQAHHRNFEKKIVLNLPFWLKSWLSVPSMEVVGMMLIFQCTSGETKAPGLPKSIFALLLHEMKTHFLQFCMETLSNTGIVQNNGVHQCEKLITAFFELHASIGHTQYSIGIFSCTYLKVQRHESLLSPMGYLFLQAPMLLPAWSNQKCSKTDSYEPRHVFSHQWLLNLLLSLLTLWKKHWMYPWVSLCLDVACQLQGLGLLQPEHICQFLDMITLSKCLLSMICKCVLPHVVELGSLVIWLAFEIVSAWLKYDKLGYQVPLFSTFSWQYPSYHVHQTV